MQPETFDQLSDSFAVCRTVHVKTLQFDGPVLGDAGWRHAATDVYGKTLPFHRSSFII